MAQLVTRLLTAESISTAGGAYVYTAGGPVNQNANSYSSAYLYVRTSNLTATPTLAVKIDNMVFGGTVAQEIMDKNHPSTEGTTQVFTLCNTVSPVEGDYGSTVYDAGAPLHPDFQITFTVSGPGAACDVDAELIWIAPGVFN